MLLKHSQNLACYQLFSYWGNRTASKAKIARVKSRYIGSADSSKRHLYTGWHLKIRSKYISQRKGAGRGVPGKSVRQRPEYLWSTFYQLHKYLSKSPGVSISEENEESGKEYGNGTITLEGKTK
jgi:hypothetical protein